MSNSLVASAPRSLGLLLLAPAERDLFSGLCSRRAAEAHLATLQEDATQSELILFDVDYFKSINECDGHSVSEAVLCEVAGRCAALLGERGVIARWCGEEVLVLACAASDGALAEAQRSAVGRVTAWFGCTWRRADECSVDTVQRADEVLCAAKRAGRYRVELR